MAYDLRRSINCHGWSDACVSQGHGPGFPSGIFGSRGRIFLFLFPSILPNVFALDPVLNFWGLTLSLRAPSGILCAQIALGALTPILFIWKIFSLSVKNIKRQTFLLWLLFCSPEFERCNSIPLGFKHGCLKWFSFNFWDPSLAYSFSLSKLLPPPPAI